MFTKHIISNTLRACKSYSSISRLCTVEPFQQWNRFPLLWYINQRNTCPYSTRPLKSYLENENNFLFNVLSSNPATDNVSVSANEQIIADEAMFTSYLNKDWRSSNASDIVRAFKTVKQFCIVHNISFEDPRFDSLVDGLMDNCENLTNHEILELLKCMAEYPICTAFNSHNYHDMWSCLDDICCWKLSTWDVDTLFAIANAWYKLKLGKLCDFIFEMLDRLVKKADKLSKDQLVHILFFFNTCRKRPVDFEYENALQHKINEMNIDELAVVALGFFKTQSKIKLDPILGCMIQEVTNKAMGIHEISLTAIMKILRFSFPSRFFPEVKKMMDSLDPELDRFSELACLHIALLCTGLQICHGNILKKCSQKIVDNFSNIRIKDIERLLNVLTMFTFDPKTKPDIFELAFKELYLDSRIAEINKYPKCLVSALNYLSLRGIYSYKLMDRILDYEYITINFGKQAKMLPRQVFSVDACIDIECPDYTGNRLSPELKYKAVKWLTDWAPSRDQYKKISRKDQVFLDTVDTVEKIVGRKENLIIQHVLPHFPSADIIICKDTETGAFIQPTGFQQYILGDVMRPHNTETFKWYSIIVLIWNNIVRDTTEPLGLMAMKQRQLKKIGYNPVMVQWNQFIPLSQEERKQYLLNLLV